MKNVECFEWELQIEGFDDLSKGDKDVLIQSIINNLQQGFLSGNIGMEVED